VEQVYFGERGLLKHARRGQLFVDHSTVGPGTSRACHEAAKAKGAGFLDAPVSGGPAGAQAATLTIMCGGDKPAFEQALPIFKAMGKNIHHVGGPGCGSIIKLANQLLVAIHTAAAAEAMVLLTKAGADPKVALEVLGTSFGASAMLNRDGPMFLERRFDPGTPVDLIHKDLRLILELADAASVRTLLGGVAKQLYAEASAMGLGQRDMAALVQPLERLAGIQIHH
jgi:3-hydroxyisobutyrate dehydrogenase/2-hydroxy-3-oxopropionate reductase